MIGDEEGEVTAMEVSGDGDADHSSPPAITVRVKFRSDTISVSISPESTGHNLKSLLQPLTAVLPRCQKLIFKGRIIEDTASLMSVQVGDGSKLMMIVSEGQQPGGIYAKRTPHLPDSMDDRPFSRIKLPDVTSLHFKDRAERWKITGVVALSEWNLKVVPHEVWDCGEDVRVLDLSNNFIQELPAKIGSLIHLSKLLLNVNDLLEEGVSWDGLSSLKSLSVLSLSQNRLTTLPSAMGTLTSLTQLHMANNKLTSLPAELGRLNQLQILNAANNRISSVPFSIGNCLSLAEIDFSSNLLVELPVTFGNLRNLKVLRVSNNSLKSLPSTLFKMCLELSILDLHGTEITNDILRQTEGWELYDARRRAKHQKQLDFRVGSSGMFDEGADDAGR